MPCQANNKSFFGMYRIKGLRLLPRLKVELSDLCKREFRHKFQCSSPMCICQAEIENNNHFLLQCTHNNNFDRNLPDSTSTVADIDLGNLSSPDLCHLLLYYHSCFSIDLKYHTAESTIYFLNSSSDFKQMLVNHLVNCSHLLRLSLILFLAFFHLFSLL